MYYGILLEMRGVTVSTRLAGGSITCGPFVKAFTY